jgi:hypothetical protein
MERYYSFYATDLVSREGSTVMHGIDALRGQYERATGLELRGALFLSLGAKGRISEISEYLVPCR